MNFKGHIKDFKFDNINKQFVYTIVTDNKTIEDETNQLIQSNKDLNIEIKKVSHKRSNDSNSYLWVLCEKLAVVLNTKKDDIYLDMLEKYGVFTHIILKPEAVEFFKKNWRLVKELGEVNVNGKKGIQVQAYFGSSTYDNIQMSRLIKGVVNECRDLNISTLSDEEINSMDKEWGI